MIKKEERKNLLKFLVPVTLVASLGACSTTDRPLEVYTYSLSPNINFDKVERDEAECTQWARNQYTGKVLFLFPVLGGSILEGFTTCMQSKGYTLK